MSVCHFWHPHHGTCTLLSPTLNKHNHCSPQRHTIFLVDFLLSSWSQSTKTYDLLKHLLSNLLHLTSTTIAVRKDIFNSARNNRCHDPTAANTTPVTQKDSHLSPHHMKRHLQCAEQQVSRSNRNKYYACHAKRLTSLSASHMKRHLHSAEQQVSRSNLTKYCTCHEK